MASAVKVLLVLRLVASLLTAVINGIELSFNTYAVAVKETFNLTQTQVEVMASMGSLGFGLMFIETIMTEVFGFLTTFVLTGLTLPVSCFLFAVAALYKDFFRDWIVLLDLIQLLLVLGSGVCYLLTSHICIELISEKQVGTFIGVFGSASCFGKIFFAWLFGPIFHNNWVGFFCCLGGLFAAFTSVCFTLLYPVAKQMELKKANNDTGNNDLETTNENKSLSEQEEKLKEEGWMTMLRSPFFQTTLWTSAVFSAICYTILNNITSVTYSIRMDDPVNILTTYAVCIMCSRLLYGFLYDKTAAETRGFYLIMTTYFGMVTGLVLVMYSLNTVTIYALTVLGGIGTGPAFTIPMAILVDRFGRSNFSFISGTLAAMMACCQMLFQLIVGFLYDTQISERDKGKHFCFGPDCFFSSFVFLLTLTAILAVVQIIHFVFERSTSSHH